MTTRAAPLHTMGTTTIHCENACWVGKTLKCLTREVRERWVVTIRWLQTLYLLDSRRWLGTGCSFRGSTSFIVSIRIPWVLDRALWPLSRPGERPSSVAAILCYISVTKLSQFCLLCVKNNDKTTFYKKNKWSSFRHIVFLPHHSFFFSAKYSQRNSLHWLYWLVWTTICFVWKASILLAYLQSLNFHYLVQNMYFLFLARPNHRCYETKFWSSHIQEVGTKYFRLICHCWHFSDDFLQINAFSSTYRS